MGRLATIRGRIAQWTAQSMEVVIPRASQLILNDMEEILACMGNTPGKGEPQNYGKRNNVAKNIVLFDE